MNDHQEVMSHKLHSWEDIQEQYEGAGLLIGNGASRSVWDRFAYDSLYEVALAPDLARHLSPVDQAIFDSLDTRNFEVVLSALRSARVIGEALSHDVSSVNECYDNVKNALIEAVRQVHAPAGTVPEPTLRAIRTELLRYSFVYSTNYDLLVYWAIMSDDEGWGFKDYLWSGRFDVTDTEIFEKATKVLYLHGGLHLVRLRSGLAAKLRWEPGKGILDQFGASAGSDFVPLFVSEGTSADKETVIRSSDYLTFALEQFAAHQGRLVVFGHSLGESDAHLVRAMQRWGNRPIAISIRPGEPHELRERMASYVHNLPKAEITFFDASTHPLGSSRLRVAASLPLGAV